MCPNVRGVIGSVVGIVLAVAACNGDSNGSADPTVPTAASSTTAAAAPDVSVIPENIDEPYLNAVLAALDKVDGDALRIIYETKRLPPEAADLLNAIYSDDWFKEETTLWFQSLARDPELKGIRPDPGNRKTVVERVISASRTCVWIAASRDLSAVNVDPGPSRTQYIHLQPLDQANDPKKVNPTSWMINEDGYRSDGQEPSDPCAPQ